MWQYTLPVPTDKNGDEILITVELGEMKKFLSYD